MFINRTLVALMLAATTAVAASAQEGATTKDPAAAQDAATAAQDAAKAAEGAAQDASAAAATQQATKPLYTVVTQSATTNAVNYPAMGGKGKVKFRGTALEPKASGEANVESKGGVMAIKAKFNDMQPASKYGQECLTYVLWAVSPEGRAVNLGEVILDGKKAEMQVTTRMQSFALIVTAEPYFAVTQVGDVVVLENTLDEKNAKQLVAVKYDHLPRGQYTINMDPAGLKPVTMDKKVPPDMYQARSAVTLAKAAGAEQYAADSFKKASDMLAQAERNLTDKEGNKEAAVPMARQAAVQAEDSRQLAIKAQAAAKAAAEKGALEAQVAEAQLFAANQVTQKEAAEKDAARARGQAAQLRMQLREQLNSVMKTTDSARGLIVSMSGLLFETGKTELLPPVREKLARVAGILLGHPGLKLEVEGHTDSVGSEESNLALSEKRAQAVRDYLTSQGVPAESIVSRGLGEGMPVASNDSKEGRSENRRVEIVVSGESITQSASR